MLPEICCHSLRIFSNAVKLIRKYGFRFVAYHNAFISVINKSIFILYNKYMFFLNYLKVFIEFDTFLEFQEPRVKKYTFSRTI